MNFQTAYGKNSSHALSLTSYVLSFGVGDEVDDEDKAGVCEDDDDDDPENRYSENNK